MSEELKHLLHEGHYEEALKESEGASDPEGLFLRAAALLGANRPQEAMDLLKENRDALWEKNPNLLMKYSFETRFSLGQFDEAYDDAAYFQNKPYVSQAVEETLRALPGWIRAEERLSLQKDRSASPEEVRKCLLEEEDDFTVLQALSALRGEAKRYLPEIREVAQSARHSNVRTYALLLLVANQDASLIHFEKRGKIHDVSPAALPRPFEGMSYDSLKRSISSFGKDTSIAEAALSLLDQWILLLYPEEPYSQGDEAFLSGALYLLAARYLQNQTDFSALFAQKGIDFDRAKGKADEIDGALREEPPLRY